ncbi:B-block binding subunit of TFIIIC [Macrophomina phaseolina MS6]|uniref:B-block binding subunit of TFIIIC n=1 Tax=Macrophomina phaseolina (strain MS6) TaxID=1126212 RepID=K2S1S6_MACPH|nr:B-block binding subunit of TFIIIC [Macrophomina phaseolina MS6]
MAKGFDDLIEFLLEEIALRGEQGATTSDFKELVDRFYAEQDDDVRPDGRAGRAAESTRHADRRLQEKVWKWLTAHPDICLEGGQGGHIPSLTEFEARERENKPNAPTSADNGESGDAAAADNAVPKLFVNEERMWMAITGHGVDPKRIPRHEFIILSIIAAHGEKGVVQPEITRISGQDKRSVPKRTDNLAKHGYITKVHVLAKGTRTSLCTLKRYAKTQREKRAALPPIHARSSPDEIKAVIFQDGLLLYDKFFDILMDILQDCKIVTIEDCKRKLGITTKTWEMKSLWRSMRRLEGLGLVRKVKAQIKGYTASQKWYRCIKIVREPTQRDRMIFVTMSMKEAKKHKRATEAGEDEDAEGDLDVDEENEEAGASQALVQQESDVQEIRRLPPQWDPDRPVINLLWDIIKTTGRSGATTAIIRDQGLGTFYRRPIDSILGRISDIWHISQPPHLRHFAIIRDTGQSDKYLHYVYRTFGNFQLAVDVAEAAWEVVITQPVNTNPGKKPRAKNQKNVRENIHQEYGELNEWGFPEIHESCFEGKNGMATLKDAHNTVMANLKLLPSRGYVPKFVTGGYVRPHRETSVDSEEDCLPSSSRKKPNTGDKRKYTRRSTNGSGPSKRKKSLLNPESSSVGNQADGDINMGDGALDGSVNRVKPGKVAGKGKATEISGSERETPRPGVYINPPWGKKQRDPSIKGRPKKAKVMVIVLNQLKGVALGSPAFLSKVNDARERSSTNLEATNAKIAAEKARTTAEEAQIRRRPSKAFKGPARSQAPTQETTSLSTEHEANREERSRILADHVGVNDSTNLPAPAPTPPHVHEDVPRQAKSVEPPIFHMLDEMAPSLSLNSSAPQIPAHNMQVTRDSTPPPSLAAINTAPGQAAATPTNVPKKRGRPRKDPNAPARPRKSAKKKAEDIAGVSALNGNQSQRLLLTYFSSPAVGVQPSGVDVSSPIPDTPTETIQLKKRGSEPKSQVQASEAKAANGKRSSVQDTGSLPVEGQYSLQTPEPFNPFQAMAEEYQRSYPTLYAPSPQPFNPFIAAAQEHNRSVTSTPLPPQRTPATNSPLKSPHQYGIGIGSHDTSQSVISTRSQIQQPHSDLTGYTMSSGPPGSGSVLRASGLAESGPVQSSTIAGGAVSPSTPATAWASNLTRPSSAASISSAPGQDYVRQILARPSSATPPYQSQDSESQATSPHGRLCDQLHEAANRQNFQSTPSPASDAVRKPDDVRGPVWGSFSPSKKRVMNKAQNSTTNPAVQPLKPTTTDGILRPSPPTGNESSSEKVTGAGLSSARALMRHIEVPDDNGSETEEEPELLRKTTSGWRESSPDGTKEAIPLAQVPLVVPEETARDGGAMGSDARPSEAPPNLVNQGEATEGAAVQDEEMQDAHLAQKGAEDVLVTPTEEPSTPSRGTQLLSVTRTSQSPSQQSQSQGSRALVDQEIAPLTQEVPENPGPFKRQKGKWLGGKKQGVKLSGGGILNFNRTKLLVSIIEKCGGVFPGDFEIHRPFVGLWNKEYGAERQVDRDTIKRTIKNAIDSRRVHRFAYSFKNKNGAMMTRHILTLPHIKQSDPLVQDTQKKVIAAWPRVYTPAQMSEFEEEVGNSWYGDKYEKDTTVRVERSNLPQWMRDLELRTAENQRKRDEEKARKLEREAKGLSRLNKPGRGRGGRGRGSGPRPLITGRTGRRQRLAGLPRPAADPDESSWNPFQSKFHRPHDLEDQDSNVLVTLSRARSFGEMSGTFQVDNFVFHRPTHDSAVLSDEEDSSMFGTPFSSRSGSPVPKTPKRTRYSSFSSTSTVDSVEIPGRLPTFKVNITPSHSRRGSIYSIASDVSSASSTASISSFRVDRAGPTEWSFKNSGPETYDPTWEIQDITTLTDPDILFYPHSGTFSTEYHVLRNARLALWVQPQAQHQQDFEDSMPRSLEQMKDSIKMKGKDRDHSRRGNQNLSKFERELIVVSHWEDQYMRKREDLGLVLRQPHFINHNFFGDHEEPKTESSRVGLKWDNPYSQLLTPFEPPSFDETDESDAPDGFVTEDGRRRRKAAGGGAKAPKRRRRTTGVDTADGSAPEPPRRRQRATKPPKGHLSRAPTQDPLCVITTADTKKLLYAMVVVQSLLGGLEGYTSWDQIRKIFSTHPRWDLTSFRNRWVWLKTRCADVVENLFEEFQQAYLLAYECGDVPAIDYENVDAYDWPYIVKWTMQNISIKPPQESDAHTELPSSRKEFDHKFDIKEVNEWSGPPKESMYNEGCLSTRRKELTQQYSFYLPLTHQPKPKPKSHAHPYSQKALDRAKTWVRATIVAPEEQFDRESFGEKLKKLDDKLVSKATSELISSKYFRDEQKGRTKPGRNYGVDRTFPKAFERQLLPSQLLDALRFKDELDKAFSNGAASYVISNAAKDGHVLATINLAQSGFIKVTSVLPPVDHTIGKPFPRLTKWGFTEGHYKTVQMDRGRLTWRLQISPTERYVYGNPLLQERRWDALPPPPLPEKGSENEGFIPLWADLFNRTIEEWWRKVVTAIVHVVFGRPGIGLEGIRKALKDAMDLWEISLCVDWLVQVGAFEEMRLGVACGEKARGWRLGEWWWCVLGDRASEGSN